MTHYRVQYGVDAFQFDQGSCEDTSAWPGWVKDLTKMHPQSEGCLRSYGTRESDVKGKWTLRTNHTTRLIPEDGWLVRTGVKLTVWTKEDFACEFSPLDPMK